MKCIHENDPELILNHTCIQFGRTVLGIGYIIYMFTFCAVHLSGMLV